MKRIHIVGRKNHGKTTLIVDLLKEFVRRGVSVGAIKHSTHIHELDVPGKDSHRLREAGGHPVAVVSADLIGLFVPRPAGDDCYARLDPLFAECQLVLVEGHLEAESPKIEVWRQAMGGSCLAGERSDISAVITDDQPGVNVPVWPRCDVGKVAESIIAMIERPATER